MALHGLAAVARFGGAAAFARLHKQCGRSKGRGPIGRSSLICNNGAVKNQIVVSLLLLSSVIGAAAPQKSAELFQAEKVWTVHLQFAAEQWAAIEPKGGGMPFGMRGPGGPGGFGMGNLLSASFLKGDTDGDKQLSAVEFAALGVAWFTQWDTKKAGALGTDELRAGTAGLFTAGMGQMMRGPGPGGPTGLVAPKGKRNGVSGMMGIDFENVHATLDFDGQVFKDVAVRYKGNGTYMQSRGKEKKSFKVDLEEYLKQKILQLN